MDKIRKALSEFWFAPKNMEATAVCRFLFGISLCFHYLTLSPHFNELFGPNGLGGSEFYRIVPWAVSIPRFSMEPLSFPGAFCSPGVVNSLAIVLILSSFMFAIGFYTKCMGWITLVLHCLFYARNEYAFWGWGDMIRPFFLYILFAPCGRWYSVDSWRRTGGILPRGERFLAPAWPLRLLQIHLCANYLVVGWARSDDPNWLSGTMLYGILSDPLFSRFDSAWRWAMPVLPILGYFSWFTEMLAPIGLWIKETRDYFLLALIALHFGLEALTMVGYWNFVMLGALTAFVEISPSGQPSVDLRFILTRKN